MQLRTSGLVPQPIRFESCKPICCASWMVAPCPVRAPNETPWTAAAEISPRGSGEAISATVSNEPEELPNSATRSGSPPNLAMFARTQRSKLVEQPVLA
jgi:hypothetical protein